MTKPQRHQYVFSFKENGVEIAKNDNVDVFLYSDILGLSLLSNYEKPVEGYLQLNLILTGRVKLVWVLEKFLAIEVFSIMKEKVTGPLELKRCEGEGL